MKKRTTGKLSKKKQLHALVKFLEKQADEIAMAIDNCPKLTAEMAWDCVEAAYLNRKALGWREL